MTELVIFDAFNTIVLPRAGHSGTFEAWLRTHGVSEPLSRLQRASEGLAHPLHSAARDIYVRWCTSALDRVAAEGLTSETEPWVVPALEQLHQGRMAALPGVVELLTDLRAHGMTIAVCSNWSWDLTDDLAVCGLLDLVDLAVSSARAGHRKPHPEIYRYVLRAAGVEPTSALFVGDSERADVTGPLDAGIPAVHLTHPSGPSTAVQRIAELAELRALLRIPGQRR